MSWIQKLYETYNNCEIAIGYSNEENKRPLLPVCHITAQAHIEITLDENGNFISANLVTDENDRTTIIPCTERSASRSGTDPECHPLSDSLQYIADSSKSYNHFVKSLTDWCESEEYSHPKARAILNYIRKKSLINDLVKHKILFVGSDGKLLAKRESKKDKKTPKDIFDLAGSQDKAFIRWVVEKPDDLEKNTWKDKVLWESWSKYYLSTKKKEPVCYVTGENALLTTLHPKYIRVKGDGAKIISANDMKDFTFRGRFISDKEAKKKNFPRNQVCAVSLEVSQKAHNALIWLISKQGKVFWIKGANGRREPSLAVVAWATSGKSIPKITDDTLAAAIGFDELVDYEPIEVSTAEDIAIKFRNRMLGYDSELSNTDNVVVMGLDSASKGRLAITYYREDLSGSDFLQRIENWHKSCEWMHEYRYKDIQDKETGIRKRYFQPFIGAPAPVNIAEAAYGDDANDKIKKATVARLLPCIIDGQPIPRDIVEYAVRRACNRIALKGLKDKFEREWNKTLSISCSLFKKYSKEEYNMALDENRKTRDYLYGRLLAIADRLEEVALFKGEKERPTHAARYMQIYSQRPNRTWTQIYLSLTPYLQMSGANFYKNLIDEVKCKFVNPEEFNLDTPLTGEFLLAYHCQRMKLRQYKNKSKVKEEEPETNNDED